MEKKVLSTLELNELIAEKAREDEAFRLALLSDPKAALNKEFGAEFPEDTNVEVHVDSPKTLHLIIPAGNTDELTDDQLDGVAGGVSFNKNIIMMYGVSLKDKLTGWQMPSISDLFKK